MRSSFVCAILGSTLTCLILISFFVYYNAGALFVGVLVILLIICSIPTCLSTLRAVKLANDVAGIKTLSSRQLEQSEISGAQDTTDDEENNDDEEDESTGGIQNSEMGVTGTKDSEGVFQVCVTYRTTEATGRLCWTMFCFEVALLFLWPLVALYLTDDAGIGSIFLVIGVFSLLRYYLNAGVVLEEVGNLKALQGKNEHQKWQNRSRTNDIVLNVTRSRTRGPWIIILGFFFFVCLILVIIGLTQNDPSQQGTTVNATPIPGFSYEREQNSLPYPTCSLDFNTGGETGGVLGGVIATTDFTFVAAMAYESNDTIRQEYYNTWFGDGVAIDHPDIVSEFRTTTNRALSPVSYNLATFPNVTSDGKPFAVVSIRGSATSWDWLTNAQLWSAALGMQFLQSFLPFGFVWRPIMDELVKAISIVESESLRRVSYYVETTDFVEWLQASGNYSDIKVTGTSWAVLVNFSNSSSNFTISDSCRPFARWRFGNNYVRPDRSVGDRCLWSECHVDEKSF